MNPIRIAILGFGKIAEDQHLPSIEANPRFKLVATSSLSREGAGQRFNDWKELIQSVEGLRAVAITTPPGPRYGIARECMLAGLHCLLEKPPTCGLAEIDDLANLADAQRVSILTAWHAQHHDAVKAAAQALAGKRIASMQIIWHEDVHKWHPGETWIWKPGGFGVFDPGINGFSIATKIFPGGLFVESADLSVPENAQTPIAADIRFWSPVADGPLTASLDWRQPEGEEWTITVSATDETHIRLEDGGSTLILNNKRWEDQGPGEYPDIYRQFADLIDQRASLVDVAPLRLLADCFLLGSRRPVEPVHG